MHSPISAAAPVRAGGNAALGVSRRLALAAALVVAAWLALAGQARAQVPEACAHGAAGPTFIDPSALVDPGVQFGHCDYVAPFAEVKGQVRVGNDSNIQDSSFVLGSARLGDEAIVAHGGSAIGTATVGVQGTCPDAASHCPSFVGFNSLVDSGIVEKDAMVTHLARVGPGVRIPSGSKVLPGRNVTSQGQVAAKTAPVTAADRAFMEGVVHVNTSFARVYTELAAEDPSNVRGINYDPGHTEFNPNRDLPTLAGMPTRDPGFNDNKDRIIGDVQLADSRARLAGLLGFGVSLRADEGEPFSVGTIREMKNRTTFHALEHTHMQLGNGARYGDRSLVHGGPDPYDPTETGANFTLSDQSVFFRSHAGDNVTIGPRSFVQSSMLASGTRVPPRSLVIDNVTVVGGVEW
jgi:carbonic anhydrase/acetyltransferase-like protein (isoleucine patch superfamily)